MLTPHVASISTTGQRHSCVYGADALQLPRQTRLSTRRWGHARHALTTALKRASLVSCDRAASLHSVCVACQGNSSVGGATLCEHFVDRPLLVAQRLVRCPTCLSSCNTHAPPGARQHSSTPGLIVHACMPEAPFTLMKVGERLLATDNLLTQEHKQRLELHIAQRDAASHKGGNTWM